MLCDCRESERAKSSLAEAERELQVLQDNCARLAAEHENALTHNQDLQHRLRSAKHSLKEVQS